MASILKSHHPQLFEKLNDLAAETMRDGALSTKVKELMATALSIAAGCELCVKIHTRRALHHGATKEEIAETIGVTVLLIGRPADVWPAQTIESEFERINK